MIKLERIHVKNYKNIAEADLELGQMNVVVGENNAGKTNLLEVIPLLNYIITGPVNEVKEGLADGGWFKTFNWFVNLSTFPHTKPISIQIDFLDTETSLLYTYYIRLENSAPNPKQLFVPLFIAEESFAYKAVTKRGNAISIFKRENNLVKYGEGFKKIDIIRNVEAHASVISLLSIISLSKNIPTEYKVAITTLGNILRSYIIYFSSHLLKEKEAKFENKNRLAYYDINSEIESIKELKIEWPEYKEALKNILNISSIDIHHYESRPDSRKKPVVFIKQRDGAKTLDVLSDGTIVLLALITKLFSDTSDIFFIEEPENSIHPRALSELIKLMRAKSLDKQFIITTHSPYLLNMIKPEEVYVASVNEEGKSEIGKLPDVKAIKKKLAKSFMDFGDIVFSEPEKEEDGD